MNPLTTRLVQKRLVCPTFTDVDRGDSRVLVRQLDSALMQVGFKMDGPLLKYVGGLSATDAIKVTSMVLDAVRALVGDHVKHNVYFKDFPRNVPDTLVFWGGLLAQYFEMTGTLTNNLLDLPGYGTYQHTYEEMVEGHAAFKPKKGSIELKKIRLGGDEREELNQLYAGLIGSTVPLNTEDRDLVVQLYKEGFNLPKLNVLNIPVRETKAIVNGLRAQEGKSMDIDTVVDVLRVAAYLSGGDVTLTEKVKFKGLSRRVRRVFLSAINELLIEDPSRIDDINNRREEFKRLAERLHAFEYRNQYPEAIKAIQFAFGDLKVQTWGYKVHTAIQNRRFTKAVSLLSEKPGVLMRNLDKIAREANDDQFATLLEAVSEVAPRVSGRVLLSLIEHLDNRAKKAAFRLFVNKKGTAYATPSTLEPLVAKRIKKVQSVLWDEIARRAPVSKFITLDPVMARVAIPLSEKTKSEGFRVMPRGSVLPLEDKPVLRFFIYWHQNGERTDYDLSAAMYDADFNYVGHISYTRLGWGGYGDEDTSIAVHSGDITSAPNGASEFIDVTLDKLPPNVHYVVPSVNLFAGNLYKDCKECFFGFMMRDLKERGKPYEARTVQTKFALRGDKNVAVPLVFQRTKTGGFEVKWLDLYLNGMLACNRVERNKYSTALLAKSLVEKQYLTMDRLLEAYDTGAKKKREKAAPIYVGLAHPDKVDENTQVYTLDNLKSLIPA